MKLSVEDCEGVCGVAISAEKPLRGSFYTLADAFHHVWDQTRLL